MSIKLHNHIQTHLDEYSGEFITTTGKPSVRDKLHGLKMYGKSVQNGTPTPEIPVPIESVAHNTSITSCGKNLFTTAKIGEVNAGGFGYNTIVNDNSYYSTLNSSGYYQGYGFITPVITAQYTFSFDFSYEILWVGATVTNCWVYFFDVTNGPAAAGHYFYRTSVGATVSRKTINFTPPTNCKKIGITIMCGGDRAGGEYHQTFRSYFSNCQFELGTVTLFTPYTGSTTNLNLLGAPNAPAEWIGQPISLMSLPDGTADEYQADEGVVIKRIEKEVLNGGVSEDYRRASYATYDRGDYKIFMYRKIGYLKWAAPIISSHFESTRFEIGAYSYANCISPYGESQTSYGLLIKIDKNLLAVDWDNSTDAQRITAFRTWLASNDVEVVYALNESITIPVIQQPPPKSVYAQPNNIFTNASPAPTISCGVRKLGNRPFIPAKLKDELGNFLVDENGNNITGVT